MKAAALPTIDEIHLYTLALPTETGELARLQKLLTPAEAALYRRSRSEQVRRRRSAGRGLLREILGGYLGREAGAVPLATGPHGKPFLADSGTLRFNLAHADDCLVLAVTAGRDVGIDIERLDAGKPLSAMAKMVFSAEERAQWSALEPQLAAAAFYRCWVRKEACLKACGRGFSLPGSSFDLPVADEKTVISVSCDNRSWQILDLGAPPGYCAALAIEDFFIPQPLPAVIHVAHRLSICEDLLSY